MAKPESALWDYLRGVLPLGGHYSRIESDTSPGIPDIHYCIQSITGFIELKISRDAPFGDQGLRKSQRDWMEEQASQGGRFWILAQVGAYCFLLEGPRHWQKFNQMNLKSLARNCAYSWIRPFESPTADLKTILTR